jgi:plasmid maintenance system antidote protein VapI
MMGQLTHMRTSHQLAPLSDLLRQTIVRAIDQERASYLGLERETGVARASIRRFVNGERTLRLDMADRLAAFFGLELRAKRKGR